jgi:hypothetical protein
MTKLVLCGAVAALLLGCGRTSTEVAFGDAVVFGVDNAPSGATLVRVSVDATCHRTKVALAWGTDAGATLLARSAPLAC